MTELPWSRSTEDKHDVNRAEVILNEDHYDLEKVKRRILEYLAVRKLAPESRGPILCFVGPPGVGKTSLGQSIARALGRKFIRMSLGGMHDEAELRGHRRTYIGALPGRIVQEIRKANTNNPVFMLDELDKVGADFRGDPTSALLEVLDPAQNFSFQDHYLNVPFDLSRVLFIGTANTMATVPAALRDRMEVIELPGYTQREKLQIAMKYLVPRQLKENGLKASQATWPEAAVKTVIESYTREAGVRELEREIGSVCRGVAALVARGKTRSRTITPEWVADTLGPRRYESELALRTSTPGVATGLAYTPAGGDIIFVEATCYSGKGVLTLTGQIGDVMKESAQAAFSLLKSRAKRLGLDPDRLANTDVHIHVPAGAVPKDGPSAGVAMFTSLMSLMSDRPVRPDVAMTGEITLRGLVLPIGGVKEKVLAAKSAGIRKVILPERNRKDLVDVPPDAKRGLQFHFVKTVEDVLDAALMKTVRPAGRTKLPVAPAGKPGRAAKPAARGR
jgi:ATP-dependent Lon protease